MAAFAILIPVVSWRRVFTSEDVLKPVGEVGLFIHAALACQDIRVCNISTYVGTTQVVLSADRMAAGA